MIVAGRSGAESTTRRRKKRRPPAYHARRAVRFPLDSPVEDVDHRGMPAPKLVEPLRGVAWFAVGSSAVVLLLVTLVDLAGVGRPDCREGAITLGSTLGLVAMTWAIPALPGVPAVLLLSKAAREVAGATVAVLLGAVTALAALLMLAMNVFSTLC